MLPDPEEAPRYWLSSVTMPAKSGLETEVPPTSDSFTSTALNIPSEHVLVLSLGGLIGVQKM